MAKEKGTIKSNGRTNYGSGSKKKVKYINDTPEERQAIIDRFIAEGGKTKKYGTSTEYKENK